jgi:hypothetical protein
MRPVLNGFDLQAAGRYRLTAHYDYSGGAGRRSAFSMGQASRMPEELEGMPPYEVVSAPLHFEITRPYDVVMKLKGPLVIGPSTTVSSLLDVSLVNRSGEAIDLPAQSDEHGMYIQIETADGQYLWSWHSGSDEPRLSFASGGRLHRKGRISLLEGLPVVPGNERWPARQTDAAMARIRVGVWLWPHSDPRRLGVNSGWIEAPIEWVEKAQR